MSTDKSLIANASQIYRHRSFGYEPQTTKHSSSTLLKNFKQLH